MATLREILSQRTELKVVGREILCNWNELLKQYPAYRCNLPNCAHQWRKINYIAFELPKEKDMTLEIIRELESTLDKSIPDGASAIRIGAYERSYTFNIPGREVKKTQTGTFLLFSRD